MAGKGRKPDAPGEIEGGRIVATEDWATGNRSVDAVLPSVAADVPVGAPSGTHEETAAAIAANLQRSAGGAPASETPMPGTGVSLAAAIARSVVATSGALRTASGGSVVPPLVSPVEAGRGLAAATARSAVATSGVLRTASARGFGSPLMPVGGAEVAAALDRSGGSSRGLIDRLVAGEDLPELSSPVSPRLQGAGGASLRGGLTVENPYAKGATSARMPDPDTLSGASHVVTNVLYAGAPAAVSAAPGEGVPPPVAPPASTSRFRGAVRPALGGGADLPTGVLTAAARFAKGITTWTAMSETDKTLAELQDVTVPGLIKFFNELSHKDASATAVHANPLARSASKPKSTASEKLKEAGAAFQEFARIEGTLTDGSVPAKLGDVRAQLNSLAVCIRDYQDSIRAALGAKSDEAKPILEDIIGRADASVASTRVDARRAAGASFPPMPPAVPTPTSTASRDGSGGGGAAGGLGGGFRGEGGGGAAAGALARDAVANRMTDFLIEYIGVENLDRVLATYPERALQDREHEGYVYGKQMLLALRKRAVQEVFGGLDALHAQHLAARGQLTVAKDAARARGVAEADLANDAAVRAAQASFDEINDSRVALRIPMLETASRVFEDINEDIEDAALIAAYNRAISAPDQHVDYGDIHREGRALANYFGLRVLVQEGDAAPTVVMGTGEGERSHTIIIRHTREKWVEHFDLIGVDGVAVRPCTYGDGHCMFYCFTQAFAMIEAQKRGFLAQRQALQVVAHAELHPLVVKKPAFGGLGVRPKPALAPAPVPAPAPTSASAVAPGLAAALTARKAESEPVTPGTDPLAAGSATAPVPTVRGGAVEVKPDAPAVYPYSPEGTPWGNAFKTLRGGLLLAGAEFDGDVWNNFQRVIEGPDFNPGVSAAGMLEDLAKFFQTCSGDHQRQLHSGFNRIGDYLNKRFSSKLEGVSLVDVPAASEPFDLAKFNPYESDLSDADLDAIQNHLTLRLTKGDDRNLYLTQLVGVLACPQTAPSGNRQQIGNITKLQGLCAMLSKPAPVPRGGGAKEITPTDYTGLFTAALEAKGREYADTPLMRTTFIAIREGIEASKANRSARSLPVGGSARDRAALSRAPSARSMLSGTESTRSLLRADSAGSLMGGVPGSIDDASVPRGVHHGAREGDDLHVEDDIVVDVDDIMPSMPGGAAGHLSRGSVALPRASSRRLTPEESLAALSPYADVTASLPEIERQLQAKRGGDRNLYLARVLEVLACPSVTGDSEQNATVARNLAAVRGLVERLDGAAVSSAAGTGVRESLLPKFTEILNAKAARYAELPLMQRAFAVINGEMSLAVTGDAPVRMVATSPVTGTASGLAVLRGVSAQVRTDALEMSNMDAKLKTLANRWKQALYDHEPMRSIYVSPRDANSIKVALDSFHREIMKSDGAFIGITPANYLQFAEIVAMDLARLAPRAGGLTAANVLDIQDQADMCCALLYARAYGAYDQLIGAGFPPLNAEGLVSWQQALVEGRPFTQKYFGNAMSAFKGTDEMKSAIAIMAAYVPPSGNIADRRYNYLGIARREVVDGSERKKTDKEKSNFQSVYRAQRGQQLLYPKLTKYATKYFAPEERYDAAKYHEAEKRLDLYRFGVPRELWGLGSRPVLRRSRDALGATRKSSDNAVAMPASVGNYVAVNPLVVRNSAGKTYTARGGNVAIHQEFKDAWQNLSANLLVAGDVYQTRTWGEWARSWGSRKAWGDWGRSMWQSPFGWSDQWKGVVAERKEDYLERGLGELVRLNREELTQTGIFSLEYLPEPTPTPTPMAGGAAVRAPERVEGVPPRRASQLMMEMLVSGSVRKTQPFRKSPASASAPDMWSPLLGGAEAERPHEEIRLDPKEQQELKRAYVSILVRIRRDIGLGKSKEVLDYLRRIRTGPDDVDMDEFAQLHQAINKYRLLGAAATDRLKSDALNEIMEHVFIYLNHQSAAELIGSADKIRSAADGSQDFLLRDFNSRVCKWRIADGVIAVGAAVTVGVLASEFLVHSNPSPPRDDPSIHAELDQDASAPGGLDLVINGVGTDAIPQGTTFYFPTGTGAVTIDTAYLPPNCQWYPDPTNPGTATGITTTQEIAAGYSINLHVLDGNAGGTINWDPPSDYVRPTTGISFDQFDPTSMNNPGFNGSIINIDPVGSVDFPAATRINFPPGLSVDKTQLPPGCQWFPDPANPSTATGVTTIGDHVQSVQFHIISGNQTGAGTITYSDGGSATYNYTEVDPPAGAYQFVVVPATDGPPVVPGYIIINTGGVQYPMPPAGSTNYTVIGLPTNVSYEGYTPPAFPADSPYQWHYTNGQLDGISVVGPTNGTGIQIPYPGTTTNIGFMPVTYPDGNQQNPFYTGGAARRLAIGAHLATRAAPAMSEAGAQVATDFVSRALDTSPEAIGFVPVTTSEKIAVGTMALTGSVWASRQDLSATVKIGRLIVEGAITAGIGAFAATTFILGLVGASAKYAVQNILINPIKFSTMAFWNNGLWGGSQKIALAVGTKVSAIAKSIRDAFNPAEIYQAGARGYAAGQTWADKWLPEKWTTLKAFVAGATAVGFSVGNVMKPIWPMVRDICKDSGKVGLVTMAVMACGWVEPTTASLIAAGVLLALENGGSYLLLEGLKRIGQGAYLTGKRVLDFLMTPEGQKALESATLSEEAKKGLASSGKISTPTAVTVATGMPVASPVAVTEVSATPVPVVAASGSLNAEIQAECQSGWSKFWSNLGTKLSNLFDAKSVAVPTTPFAATMCAPKKVEPTLDKPVAAAA